MIPAAPIDKNPDGGSDLIFDSRDLARFMAEHQVAGEIVHCTAPTPTVEAAAQVMGVVPDRIVKTVLFTVSGRPVAVIACGTRPIDSRRIAARFGVGRKQVRLADADTVLSATGYPAGTVPPFGHRMENLTLIDPRVIGQPEIFAGGGEEDALVHLDPQEILRATRGEVMAVTVPDLDRDPNRGEAA